MNFSKYHALGNDYLVVDPKGAPASLTTEQIKVICHRNFGVGSDGILLGPLPAEEAQFALRIFNPDGSEAEKSGNGLRIFSRYLWDQRLVQEGPFSIQTSGGVVQSVVLAGGKLVRVEMGTVSFWSDQIPVAGRRREVINEDIRVGNRAFAFCAATIGNPHCVVRLSEVGPELAKQFGPLLEVHPMFPKRTNIQFLQVLDQKNIRIEIWERGAGQTLASGTSACAAAAVARRLSLVESSLTVHMPGGTLEIEIAEDYFVSMIGPVTKVAEGTIAEEIFRSPVK